MDLSSKIKSVLESKFGFEFDVIYEKFPSKLKYKISIYDSGQNYFIVNVEIKDNVRLTIEAEPDKYGANFLKMINNSNYNKRMLFVKYWDAILINKNKVKVKINDQQINKEDFLQDNQIWKTFNIRSTKSPYFIEEKEKENVILNNIILIIGMMVSLLDYEIIGYEEGNEVNIISKKYERNPLNRELCLALKGYKCECCGFDFYEKYGDIGKNFIEVHHIKPVSQLGDHYIIDPIKDLVPVCPNCHAMLHKKNPPYTINELKEIIRDKNDNDK